MSASEIGPHCLDEQWAQHYEEASRLAWRKLSLHLSQQDKEILWRKLHEADYKQTAHAIPVTPGGIETYIQPICEKFGVETLGQLVRWALFTSEEEIKAYVES